MRHILLLICLCCFQTVSAQFKGLIVNEFSQGNSGSREYIELLVVGNRTCSDSTADIRGWIVDDQNGWYGTISGADGHYRFRDIPTWAAVPYGSIILLYNSASGQKNLSITLADDPADANKDYAYVLPINSSAYLEEHDNEPTNAAGVNYIYPAASSATGYAGSTNTWLSHISLNNIDGDVISIISRNKRDSAFYSIGYGYNFLPGFRYPTLSIPAVGDGFSAGLTDSNYTLVSRWGIAPVPSFETPGLPNGAINSTWIQGMRMQAGPVNTYTTACSNGPYLFFNQTLVTTGAYQVLTNNMNGCIDTNDLYVVIKRNDVIDTTGCDSLIYRGTKYTNNATIVDFIKSVVVDCDSLVRTVNIRINRSSSSLTSICLNTGQSFSFNNQPITTSGIYTALLTNARNCDSVARLHIVFKTFRSDTLRGCGSVVYKGVPYSVTTILYDTLRSVLVPGCDSLVQETVIEVAQAKHTYINDCATEGSVYSFHGQTITATGMYAATLQTASRCDSIVHLYVVFRKTDAQTIAGCDSVVQNGIVYYQPAILRDTIKSLVTGCDSIIHIQSIVINQSKKIQLSACTQTNSYAFFGQTLTATGLYSQTLSTSSGCDSLIQLYLVFTKSESQTLTGCNMVVFNGSNYTASTTVKDTVRSLVSGCDSILRTTNIQIYNKADLSTSKDTAICKGDTAILFANSSNGTVTWQGFGTTNAITVTPVATTSYTVTASHPDGCTNTKTITVTVQDLNLQLTALPATALPGKHIQLQTSANLPYTVLRWVPSVLFSSPFAKTQMLFAHSSLTVSVIAQTAFGCLDTATTNLTITPLDDIYIPSAFTPNGDGKNEVLRVVGYAIRELDFKIFNRWGQLVFATTENNSGWDGRLSGKLQPADVYVYVVRARLRSGQIREKEGQLR